MPPHHVPQIVLPSIIVWSALYSTSHVPFRTATTEPASELTCN